MSFNMVLRAPRAQKCGWRLYQDRGNEEQGTIKPWTLGRKV